MKVILALLLVGAAAVAALPSGAPAVWSAGFGATDQLVTGAVCKPPCSGAQPTILSTTERNNFVNTLINARYYAGVETFDTYQSKYGNGAWQYGGVFTTSLGINIDLEHPLPPSAPVNGTRILANADYLNVADADQAGNFITEISIPEANDGGYVFISDQNDLDTAQRADRALFAMWLYVAGSPIAFGSGGNLTIEFNPPVDGVGFYLRDVSTGAGDIIVNLHCVNGMVDQFTREVTSVDANGQPTSVDERAADVTYFWAMHNTCMEGARCAKLVFSNIASEDIFGMDEIVVANSGAKCNPGTLEGYVFLDADDSSTFDQGELGISGVQVTLREGGSCSSGTVVGTATTSASGHYQFTGIVPDANAPRCFSICETQPAAYWDGGEQIQGTPVTGGQITPNSNDQFDQVCISTGGNQFGGNYNFGELPKLPCEPLQQKCYNQATAQVPEHEVATAATVSGTGITFVDCSQP